MRRWLVRRSWKYIQQQLKDVAVILDLNYDSLRLALEWVLIHGRPPEDYPKG